MSEFTNVTVKISKTETKRLTAGKEIDEKFNLSAAEAEVKFSNIRTAYDRYLKQLKTLPSGSGRDAVPREFQNLEWLNPHISHRPSSTDLRSKSPAGTAESSLSPRSSCLFKNIFRAALLSILAVCWPHSLLSII